MEESEEVYGGWYRLSTDLLALETKRILELDDQDEKNKRLEELKDLFEEHARRCDCE